MAHTNRTNQSISITYLLSSSKIWAVLLHNLQQIMFVKTYQVSAFTLEGCIVRLKEELLGYSGFFWVIMILASPVHFLINAVIHLCSCTIIGFVERARLRVYT